MATSPGTISPPRLEMEDSEPFGRGWDWIVVCCSNPDPNAVDSSLVLRYASCLMPPALICSIACSLPHAYCIYILSEPDLCILLSCIVYACPCFIPPLLIAKFVHPSAVQILLCLPSRPTFFRIRPTSCVEDGLFLFDDLLLSTMR